MLRILPSLLLGMILAAYWGRVVRMAIKTRRRTGRAANIVPAEKVGRFIRLIWFPVVVIWIVQPFAVAFMHDPPVAIRPLFYTPWVCWLAAGIALGCLVLSIRCWKVMGRHWRMGIDPGEQNALISAGPFAWVRHPIYALSSLMMLATLAALPTPLMLACGVIHLVLLAWESRREEQHMLRIHGNAYVDYCHRVGGFVPNIGSLLK